MSTTASRRWPTRSSVRQASLLRRKPARRDSLTLGKTSRNAASPSNRRMCCTGCYRLLTILCCPISDKITVWVRHCSFSVFVWWVSECIHLFIYHPFLSAKCWKGDELPRNGASCLCKIFFFFFISVHLRNLSNFLHMHTLETLD